MEKSPKTALSACVALIIALLGLLGYAFFLINGQKAASATLAEELRSTKNTLAQKEADILAYGNNLKDLQQAYGISEENGAELLHQLNKEKDKNAEFEDQISDITGTIGQINKLAKIDPELLVKYSRVYFLNENYAPEKIAEIRQSYTFKTEEKEYIHGKIANRLDELIADAKDDGVEMLVLSGYRSFDEQMQLKSAYTTTYGSGANAFSADQGYSEHQLGTAVDFTTTAIGAGLTGFDTTEAYAWLLKNAYKYGFVISYPKANAYYIFEPWHWRFVGEKLAGDLHDDGKFFYDMDQRKIDEYLISFFD